MIHRAIAPLTATMLGLGLLATPAAQAGTGPWILGKGDAQVYVGLDAQRFTRLAVGSGSYTDDVIDVDQGVQSFGAKGIFSIGVAPRFQVEAEVPYQVAFTPSQGGVCELLALGACNRTAGIGIITLRNRVLVLDEIAGNPVSISLGLDARFGQLTQAERERITNLGEGTFDIQPVFSLGRIGALGMKGGSYSTALDLGWRYRVPMRTDFGDGSRVVPGWEVVANHETLFSPVPAVAFGPAVDLLWRPNGVDFSETDLTDVDRFGALRILALSAGGKVLIRGSSRVTVALSAFHTVYAINNPSDVFTVSAGVSIGDLFRRRRQTDDG